MSYQVFTRYSGSGSHAMSKPRRRCVMLTQDGARSYCTRQNAERSRPQVRAGMFWEYTTTDYFREAWGR